MLVDLRNITLRIIQPAPRSALSNLKPADVSAMDVDQENPEPERVEVVCLLSRCRFDEDNTPLSDH